MWGNFFGRNIPMIFAMEMIVGIAVLTQKFRRRENFFIRTILCVGSLVAIAEMAEKLVKLSEQEWGFDFFIMLFLGLFCFFCIAIPICYYTTLYDVLFCGIAAYAVQNSLYQFTILMETALRWWGIRLEEHKIFGLVLLVLCHVVTYVGMYKLVSPLTRQHYPVDKAKLTGLFCVMLVVVLRVLPMPSDTTTTHYVAWLFLHILVNILSLCVLFGMSESNQMKQEMDTLQKMWKLKEEHYEQSRQVTESINIKCHDLRYQIRELRREMNDGAEQEALREIEKAVLIYDAIAKTGNDALDTILTEKSLFCEKNGIQFTYMADGSKLDFVKPMDIYVIFGNALDNAIESVMKISQPERRIITLNVSGNGRILTIQLKNTCQEQLQIEDGLPLTSKKDAVNHGYGMRSIQILSQKYGGDMTFAAENGVFSMNILLNAG